MVNDEFKPFETKVRGKKVFFYPETIKKFLGEHFYNKVPVSYYTLKEEGIWDLDEVLNTICAPRTIWSLDAKRAPHKVDRKSLLPIARVWFTFINHTLSHHLISRMFLPQEHS